MARKGHAEKSINVKGMAENARQEREAVKYRREWAGEKGYVFLSKIVTFMSNISDQSKRAKLHSSVLNLSKLILTFCFRSVETT
jgi:hypothetical protein